MAVSRDGTFLGVLGLADTLRPAIAATMQRLRALGVQHLVIIMPAADGPDGLRRVVHEVVEPLREQRG